MMGDQPSADVILWGRRIAAAAIPDPGDPYVEFQYRPEFVAGSRGLIEPAPLTMPLRDEPYVFRALGRESFQGMPGLLADSLPDKFGSAVIDAWLQSQRRSQGSMNGIEKLCYIGTRGMGALEFEPATNLDGGVEELSVADLTELAREVLNDRKRLVASLKDPSRSHAVREILRVGSSAGGARPKALIAYAPETGDVRSGQLDRLDGYEHWLLKFDGISDSTREDSFDGPLGYGLIEYSYYLLARRLGIEINDCRLLEEGPRRHFMTKRFDRGPAGEKIHMQTLGAIAHLDFNLAGANSYEQAFDAASRIGVDRTDVEQLYRRMVFNVVARNCDDHVKNISFLMDRDGRWRLAPAYDLTYAYNPDGQWTSSHQMTVNGKRRNFTMNDMVDAARIARLPRGRGQRIVDETIEAVDGWPEIAAEVGVDPSVVSGVRSMHVKSLA